MLTYLYNEIIRKLQQKIAKKLRTISVDNNKLKKQESSD